MINLPSLDNRALVYILDKHLYMLELTEHEIMSLHNCVRIPCGTVKGKSHWLIIEPKLWNIKTGWFFKRQFSAHVKKIRNFYGCKNIPDLMHKYFKIRNKNLCYFFNYKYMFEEDPICVKCCGRLKALISDHCKASDYKPIQPQNSMEYQLKDHNKLFVGNPVDSSLCSSCVIQDAGLKDRHCYKHKTSPMCVVANHVNLKQIFELVQSTFKHPIESYINTLALLMLVDHAKNADILNYEYLIKIKNDPYYNGDKLHCVRSLIVHHIPTYIDVYQQDAFGLHMITPLNLNSVGLYEARLRSVRTCRKIYRTQVYPIYLQDLYNVITKAQIEGVHSKINFKTENYIHFKEASSKVDMEYLKALRCVIKILELGVGMIPTDTSIELSNKIKPEVVLYILFRGLYTRTYTSVGVAVTLPGNSTGPYLEFHIVEGNSSKENFPIKKAIRLPIFYAKKRSSAFEYFKDIIAYMYDIDIRFTNKALYNVLFPDLHKSLRENLLSISLL